MAKPVKISDKMHDTVKKMAVAEKRSIGQQLEYLLEQALKMQGVKT